MNSDLHPLDQSTRLHALDDNSYRGRISPAYANMVGPYGGAIAASMLAAALQHPQRLGEPLALTVNFAGPIADAEFVIRTRIARTNRSTQHWLLELEQAGEIAITATLMTGERRETWSDQEISCPPVPPADSLPVQNTAGFPTWTRSYRMRFIEGRLTLNPADASDSSLTRLWVDDQPPRPLDFLSLTALTDVFFPRVFQRTQSLCPVGTVTLTSYFHVNSEELAALGSGPVLACARGQIMHNGYADQTGELWSVDGRLLATTQQLLYYKR